MTLAEAEHPTSPCPDVRLGRIEDRAAILDLCYRLADENAVFPVNPAKVAARVDQSLSRNTGMMIGVSTTIEDDKEVLCGAICLEIVSMWYSDVPFYTDVFNYVDKTRRAKGMGVRGTYARQQLRFARMVGDQFGVPLFASIMTTLRTEQKMRLYEAEGFKMIGGNFCYIPDEIKHLFKGSWSFKDAAG